MAQLDNLLRQHKDIMDEVKHIEDILNKSDYENFLGDLAIHISLLAGKLKIHLTNEDKFLYPDLLNNQNDKIKKMATEYINEMGQISELYTNYKNQFNTKSKIDGNINTFLKQSHDIISAIKVRISKEENELYKLISNEKK